MGQGTNTIYFVRNWGKIRQGNNEQDGKNLMVLGKHYGKGKEKELLNDTRQENI